MLVYELLKSVESANTTDRIKKFKKSNRLVAFTSKTNSPTKSNKLMLS